MAPARGGGGGDGDALSAPAAYSGTTATLVSGAWALGDFALLRYPSSERSDPVLSTPDLRRFLYGLLEAAQASISGRHIGTTLRARFAYAYAPGTVELDDAPELIGSGSPEQEVILTDAARVALAALTGRQLQVLAERPDGTLEALAARLEVSRGTVDNEYRRAVLKVREASPSNESFNAVLEKVLAMASREGQADD